MAPTNFEFKLTSFDAKQDPYVYQCQSFVPFQSSVVTNDDKTAGFDNYLESEAVPGALPVGQNNPQIGRFFLCVEQIDDD